MAMWLKNMPSLTKFVKYLHQPELIVERLVEKRMNSAARRFYAEQTPSQVATRRLQALGQFGDAYTYSEEARQSPVFAQIKQASQSDEVQLKIASSQTTSLDDCITMYTAVRLWHPKIMVETGYSTERCRA
jgi:hypothetical protein